MSKTKTDESRFVLRLALAPSAAQRVELLARMKQARKLYNIVLKECIKRVQFIKSNKTYQKICKARRASSVSDRKTFQAQLNAIQNSVPGLPGRSFSRWSALEKELRDLRKVVAPRLGAQPANTIGERAFDTAAKWLYGGDRPRFRKGHEFISVNGNQHITLRDDPNGRYVKWGDLEIPVWFRKNDERVEYALSHRISSIEIVFNGDTFAAHCICVGSPMGVPTRPGVVGVDPGVSHISVVSDDDAVKFDLRVTSKAKWAYLRRLQRHAQRQADAAKASKKRSKSLRKTRRDIARLQRKEATTNKQATNIIAKSIVARGSSIRMESNNYKAFQATYGKRMQSTRPGALARRITQLTPDVTQVDCRLALSQMCICGRRVKKKLSQRVHKCECGVTADRDLWSAFLARHVVTGKLDLDAARKAYPTAQSRLSPRGRVATPSTNSAGTGYASGAVAPLTSEVLADVNPGNPGAKLGNGPGRKSGSSSLGQALEVDGVTTRNRSTKSERGHRGRANGR